MKLEPLEVKSDRRGSLIEAFKLPNDGQIFYATIQPGEIRGNHYHTRKKEYFVVVHGSATITCKDRDTGTVMNVVTGGQNPMLVEIVPNHTHNITSEDGCMFIVWTNEQFNPSDPDTFAEEI